MNQKRSLCLSREDHQYLTRTLLVKHIGSVDLRDASLRGIPQYAYCIYDHKPYAQAYQVIPVEHIFDVYSSRHILKSMSYGRALIGPHCLKDSICVCT